MSVEHQTRLLYPLNKFYQEKVMTRNAKIRKALADIMKVITTILKEVEIQEPRYISSLVQNENGIYEGLNVVSSTEFEITLFLNQMGVFNFVDDGSIPGCAVLKLSDGRKRSMSLWVEFITASGYLSSRKMRSKFQTLLIRAVEKSQQQQPNQPNQQSVVKAIQENSSGEVKLQIFEKYFVTLIPAFKCSGIWPRSAAQWPMPHIHWPHNEVVAAVKNEGFSMLSRENPHFYVGKQNASSENDAWLLCFNDAENILLSGGCRKTCLSILKTLRDRNLDLREEPIKNYHLKTLVLFECEKHPREMDWDIGCLGDRIIGEKLFDNPQWFRNFHRVRSDKMLTKNFNRVRSCKILHDKKIFSQHPAW